MPQLQTRMEHLNWGQKQVLKLYPPPQDKLYMIEREYTYRPVFPRQQDQFLRFLRDAIRNAEKNDMDIAGAGFSVFPLTMSPPIWPNSGHVTKVYAMVCG